MTDSGCRFARWQADAIREILKIPGVEPVLLIQDAQPISLRLLDRIKRVQWKLLLGQVYVNLFCQPRAATEIVDLTAELGHVTIIGCQPELKGKYSAHFRESDLARIRECRPDFLLRFGFNIIRGEILRVPRYGVWSYHHDDEQVYRGSSVGLWEIVKDDPVTAVVLQRLTDRLDGGVILKKGYFPTTLRSLAKTRETIFNGATTWPAQVCHDILCGQANYVDGPPSSSRAPIYRRPTNLQTLALVFTLARNQARYLGERLFVQTTWGVGIWEQPIGRVLKPGQRIEIRYFPELSTSYSFCADPFGIVRDGTLNVLCEKFPYGRSSRGGISTFRLEKDLDGRHMRPAFDVGTHMSYPFLLQWNDEIYCIPEIAGANRISLFKATRFPEEWVEHSVLVEGFAGVDSSVAFFEGRWWLFTSNGRNGIAWQLHIYYADRLEGPWFPHPLNPVKTDVRSSRSAGTPFIHEGVLFRPAQDCSRGYGRRVVVNRVLKLTPTDFIEVAETAIGPDMSSPFPHGIHHLASVGTWTLVDGRRDVFDLFKQPRKRMTAAFHAAARTAVVLHRSLRRRTDSVDEVLEDGVSVPKLQTIRVERAAQTKYGSPMRFPEIR
jgi:hypothetical protein